MEWAEFSVVRDTLEVSDPVLSKQVGTLVAAGHPEQRRATRDTRRRVWLRLSKLGRTAHARHLAALREIVGDRSL
ncbi:DNA-binding MarR family transcriptional regulator [Saccharopolyspora lacisalsi]|uniref:DNA-binding MarR family transcriptional regulator n=1 Tax=Halosaccharopolyspora lacisalsi TaxID=1000566 RepID=A0A839E6Y1_9PSEU|nr:DNA-binding MarR family transcriptional regulator [Halosaccharopolyspora lacisalsi]